LIIAQALIRCRCGRWRCRPDERDRQGAAPERRPTSGRL